MVVVVRLGVWAEPCAGASYWECDAAASTAKRVRRHLGMLPQLPLVPPQLPPLLLPLPPRVQA